VLVVVRVAAFNDRFVAHRHNRRMLALRDPKRFVVRLVAFVALHALLIGAALAVATYN
jgi:hypothetical protein